MRARGQRRKASSLGEISLIYRKQKKHYTNCKGFLASIKGQVVADILADFPVDDTTGIQEEIERIQRYRDEIPEAIYPDLPEEEGKDEAAAELEERHGWTLFVDGSCNSYGSGAGVVLVDPSGVKIEKSIRIGFSASNNEAEYEALIAGLRTALDLGMREVKVYSDSQLVVEQFYGRYAAREERLERYRDIARKWAALLNDVKVERRPRLENRHADSLAFLATAMKERCPRQIRIEYQEQPTDLSVLGAYTVSMGQPSWIDPILAYLKNGALPRNAREAREIRRKSAQYTLIEGKLFLQTFGGPLLRCLKPDEAQQVLQEIHAGDCGSHSGGRSLAHKAITQGDFWPYMHADAKAVVRKCEQCQKYGKQIHVPAEVLHPILSPWPFAL